MFPEFLDVEQGWKMAKATKTVNPIHFEDLEPHRFEDLVRQLAYEYREWRTIEATGRLGKDQGLDIRAIEVLTKNVEEDEEPKKTEERLWIFQCKRERRLYPKRDREIVTEDLKAQPEAPYGYILAAACDFSKNSLDAVRDVARDFGVSEYDVWGKARLEDFLFQPKNDHLLFAYFGISLRTRRRSTRTEIRSRLALKRKLVMEFGELRGRSFKRVLIRDPRDTTYPYPGSVEDFVKKPRWRYWDFHGHEPPDHVALVTHRFMAYTDWENEKWDAYLQFDMEKPSIHEIWGIRFDEWPHDEKAERFRECWNDELSDANRAWMVILGFVPYERILAVDDLGDAFNEGPHLIVEHRPGLGPFADFEGSLIRPASGYLNRAFRARKENRRKFLPKKPSVKPKKEDKETP